MKPIPHTPELRGIALRIMWFDSPERALADPVRFMSYVFAYATEAELKIVWRHVTREDALEALDKSSHVLVDDRLWGIWNAILGRYPKPERPPHDKEGLSDANPRHRRRSRSAGPPGPRRRAAGGGGKR